MEFWHTPRRQHIINIQTHLAIHKWLINIRTQIFVYLKRSFRCHQHNRMGVINLFAYKHKFLPTFSSWLFSYANKIKIVTNDNEDFLFYLFWVCNVRRKKFCSQKGLKAWLFFIILNWNFEVLRCIKFYLETMT